MKACKKCGVVKALSEFYAHPKARDGHSGICKVCKIDYVQGKYERKRQIVPAGHKFCARCKLVKPVEEFGRNAARVSKRGGTTGYQPYCKTCWPEYQRYYRKRPEAGFMAAEKLRKQRKSLVRRRRDQARQLTQLAVMFGYLIPTTCEVLGCTVGREGVVAHHTQYDKPLDGIRWLCATHHLEVGHGGLWTNPPR